MLSVELEQLIVSVCATISSDHQGFVVQPKRWIVERTFGWRNRERCLTKDYERKEESSEAFIALGMARLMLRCLA